MPVRKVDVYDGALPSANAVMAHNLWLCGMCASQSGWIEQATTMLAAMSATSARYAYSFSYWGIQMQRLVAGAKVAVCSGSGTENAVNELGKRALPHLFALACKKEISELPLFNGKFVDGPLSIFVCSEEACLAPVGSVGEALAVS